MICCLYMMALSLKMIDLYFQLLPVQQISKVIVFTAASCHVWHPGPDATLLIIWRTWRMWKVVDLVFFQVSWSPLASPQVSKVIVFTAASCHAWHPGPDATLMIIWRRRRMWMQVNLFPSISFISTSNNFVVSSLLLGTEMLVDIRASYDDFSGLWCNNSWWLYFAGHEAIWRMRLGRFVNHRWQLVHCTEDILVGKFYGCG